jgi:transcription initiation factor TFIID TATA-box-binding protein
MNQQGRGKRMVEPRDSIKIVNVVASTSIGQEINLKQVTLALDGADYNPKEFPGLVYRLSDPKVVILLFSSGKLVITGGKKPEDVVNAVDRIVKELKILSLL